MSRDQHEFRIRNLRQRAVSLIRRCVRWPGTPVALLWLAIVAGAIWCLEPWQRPRFVLFARDSHLLGGVVFGLIGAGICFGGRHTIRIRFVQATTVVTCGLMLLFGARRMAEHAAFSKIELRLDEEIRDGWHQRGYLAKENSVVALCVNALRHLGIAPPMFLLERMHPNDIRFPKSPINMLTRSRPGLREKFLRSTFEHEARSRHLMTHWREYLPIMIGPDVKLEQRIRWLDHLDLIRQSPEWSVPSKNAAVFFMALIVLTDVQEFDDRLPGVREAMLTSWPPGDRAGDYWMRTLDVLIACAPPKLWEELSAPLAENPSTLTLARRLRVRGLPSHSWNPPSHDLEETNRMNAELKAWLNYGVILEDLQDHSGIDPVVRRRVMELARKGADPAWKILYHFDPIEELWRRELDNPESASLTTRYWMRDEEKMMQFHSFVDVLEHPSTDSKVLLAVWDELRRGARDRQIQDKSQIYSALMRLSPLLPENERLEMRSEFHQAKVSFMSFSEYDGSFHGTYFEPHHPLMYLGGGLAIPWENDALSAVMSWPSQYRRAVYPYPVETFRVPPNDIFSFIALGFNRSDHSGAWGHRMESISPLNAPFAPTAWQNARALHLRNPELRFP